MKFILIAALMSLVFGKANSQTTSNDEWIYIMSTKDGSSKSFIRNKCVDNGQYIKIWTKVESKKQVINRKIYFNVSILFLQEYDCDNLTYRSLAKITHDSKGKVINSKHLQEYEIEWHEVVPGSIGEAALNKICELYR